VVCSTRGHDACVWRVPYEGHWTEEHSMVGQQPWPRVRQASRVTWAVCFRIVVGACSLIPPVRADPGLTSRSLRGTWAFAATGTLPTPSAPPTPCAVVGWLTFARHDACAMTFTINAGGQSWDSVSDTCTLRVHADGTATLKATFVPGNVPFPPLALFSIVSRNCCDG